MAHIPAAFPVPLGGDPSGPCWDPYSSESLLDSPISLIETELLESLPFPALDTLKNLFLQAMVTDRDPQKSARAVVQLSYETELRVFLASVNVPLDVLESGVCLRRRYLEIDTEMHPWEHLYLEALSEALSQGYVTLAYAESIQFRFGGAAPRVRVNAVAVLLVLSTWTYHHPPVAATTNESPISSNLVVTRHPEAVPIPRVLPVDSTCWDPATARICILETEIYAPFPDPVFNEFRAYFLQTLTTPREFARSTRVAIQVSQASELSVFLTDVVIPLDVLESNMCTRRRYFEIAMDMQLRIALVFRALDVAVQRQLLTPAYAAIIESKLNSPSPRIRVSAMAVLLVLSVWRHFHPAAKMTAPASDGGSPIVPLPPTVAPTPRILPVGATCWDPATATISALETKIYSPFANSELNSFREIFLQALTNPREPKRATRVAIQLTQGTELSVLLTGIPILQDVLESNMCTRRRYFDIDAEMKAYSVPLDTAIRLKVLSPAYAAILDAKLKSPAPRIRVCAMAIFLVLCAWSLS